jgi:hypothetical protein
VKPGDQVFIRSNPHRADAEGIVGVVERYEEGVGFGGCDLAYVRYADPWSGTEEVLPFGLVNLRWDGDGDLLAAAERMEDQARKLREMLGAG